MSKKVAKNIKMKSIFESDSEEDMPSTKYPKIPQKKLDLKRKIKEESLEDPSIYEYDSIYDDMKAKQVENAAPKEKKNSRYIETLLKAADKRKKEHECRIEKKIQIERVKEGDKFKDKESFVTSSYKKKMQEREEEEERERRENVLNEMMDVTKQKDLSGFYRHFLNQTIGEEKIPIFDDKHKKEEIMRIKEENSAAFPEDADSDSNHEKQKIHIEEENSASYPEDADSDSNHEKEKIHIKEENSTAFPEDADSDSNHEKEKVHIKGINSTINLSDSVSNDDDDDENNYTDKQKLETHKSNVEKERHTSHNNEDESKISDTPDEKTAQRNSSDSEKQARRNIFIKRTVGDVFAEAQARYFQRMNKKNNSIS